MASMDGDSPEPVANAAARLPMTAELPEMDEQVLRSRLGEVEHTLLDISRQIHAKPEIRFEEHFASKLLADTLRRQGFEVETGMAGLPTAFLAQRRGSGGPTIAFFCEYDALEEIGHGCGHNIIAAAGLGAGLLTADWLVHQEKVGGRIVVVGSPGEEGGGGKAILIDHGCLEGIDAAMMIHPAGDNLSCMTTLARAGLDITFKGRAAHAGVSPERGVNALDAAVLTLTAIGLLRQQLPPDAQVHAVITHGGDAPNIIPETAAIRAYARAATIETLEENVKPRVENCARGAALATGARVEIRPIGPTYASLRPNPVLGALVERNFHHLGRRTRSPHVELFPGSTDMGNVSRVIPSLPPSVELVPGLGLHSREAAAFAGGPEGDRAVLDGALLLAMTATQLLLTPGLLDEVRSTA
jgi:amidohydrolase